MFCTTVHPMFVDQHKEVEYDLTLQCTKTVGKYTKNTVFGCNLRVAQGKRLQFYQARSNVIILYDTLLAMCIEKVVVRKVRRIIVQQNVSVS